MELKELDILESYYICECGNPVVVVQGFDYKKYEEVKRYKCKCTDGYIYLETELQKMIKLNNYCLMIKHKIPDIDNEFIQSLECKATHLDSIGMIEMLSKQLIYSSKNE